VYVILIMKAWTASSKGHNNLTKLNVITSSICMRFSNVNNIRLCGNISSLRSLQGYFFK
jgi:hypothetical protein